MSQTVNRGIAVFVIAAALAAAVAASESATAQQAISQRDIEVRDQLIADQEALLNTYRCLFDIDTQVVPGGCTDMPVSADTTQTSSRSFTAIASNAPDGTFTAIAPGAVHTCGIRTDGTIQCWDWITNLPEGVTWIF